MERFVKGDIVVFPFPFSEISTSKKRPALVLAVNEKEIILAEIRSKSRDKKDILINKEDFQHGKLKHESFVRPLRLLTVHESRILYKAGTLKHEKFNEILNNLFDCLKS